MNINLLLGIISISWLVFVTGFLIWLTWVLRGLFKNAQSKDFINVFKSIQDTQIENSKNIKEIKKEHSELEAEVLNHIQKMNMVKFSAFSEAGGEHSFSLVLLDGKKNGIIITSLHARERTRVYAKEIKKGKATIELSKEEQKTLSLSLAK